MRLTLTAITCLFGITSLAQHDVTPPPNTLDTSINAIAHWKKGETKYYLVNHDQESTKAGEPEVTRSKYYASVKVLDASADGYTLQWNYVAPPPNDKSSKAKEMYQLYKSVKIIFKTSPRGMFADLVNWQDLRDFYLKLVDKSISKKGDPASDSVLDKVKQMFNTKMMVVTTMAKEVLLLYAVYGKTYTTRGRTINTEFPNPFIPVQTIPALLSMKIEELDAKEGNYTILVNQRFDSDATSQLFESVIDKMDIRGNDSLMLQVKKMLSNFEMSDYSEYRISSKSGWVSRMIYSKEVTSNIFKQKDFFWIEERDRW